MNQNKTLIFIPTYNEKTNVKIIYDKLNDLKLEFELLFLDDDSPDGTGLILDEISKSDNKVKIIHRKTSERGIGSAHMDGINYAYDKNYNYLITMDCDLSHSPEYIYDFIKLKQNYDLVIGTRFINKESIISWNLYRKILTYLGHLASRLFLGLKHDSTGAFRLYNLNNIDRNFVNLINFKRYSFFFESLFILNYNKYKIGEIPINLPSRVYGQSKQTFKDVFIGVKNLFLIFLNRIFNKDKYRIKKNK